MGRECLYITAIALCLILLISVEVTIVSPSLQSGALISRLISYRPSFRIVIDDGGETPISKNESVSEESEVETMNSNSGFTVIIVTYNEPLLYKT